MKMNRAQLKAMVKECLLEILAEGIGSTPVQEVASMPRPQRSMGGSASMPSQPVRQPTQHLRAAVKEVAGGNPVLESILADTAKNTLPGMMGGETAGMPVNMQSPDEFVNEEASAKWLAILDRTSVG